MNWTLLQKYLSGECTTKERKKVQAWIHAEKENRDFMASLKKIWEVEPKEKITVDAQSAWQSFQHKLEDHQSGQDKKSTTQINRFSSDRKFGRTKAFSLAAAAMVLIAFLLYVYIPQFNAGSAEMAAHKSQIEKITTRKGQRTTLRLADGTQVHLNAASTIKIPADFDGTTRNVYLEGEAYFEVAHNLEKPFVVHTPHAYTKVLGTKFGVKAYPEDTDVRVVVREGRVALGSTANPDTTHNKIIRNQMGVLGRQGEMTISEVPEVNKYLGWKDGQLIFESTPLKEMRPQLERWFDVEIEIADSSLNAQPMTATFNDEPMPEVFKIIALSLDANYEREGRHITFHSN